jgi:hypothetical protein
MSKKHHRPTAVAQVSGLPIEFINQCDAFPKLCAKKGNLTLVEPNINGNRTRHLTSTLLSILFKSIASQILDSWDMCP